MAELAWRLRQAAAADADGLSLIANAAFLDTYAHALDGGDLVAHCLKHNSAEVFWRWARDSVSILTLAELEPGHAPIGYTVLTTPDFPVDPQPGDIELRRIYTLKQMHGSGLGVALMARATEDARARGGKRMLLGVWDENHRARGFYERTGFRIIGTRPFQVGSEIHNDPIYALDL